MILALDNSGREGSVALMRDGEAVQEVRFENPRGRGGELFRVLEELLREKQELTKVVVGIGPGSYNGIRSAIGAAWGIAASQGVPLVGVSSLLALGSGEYCAVGDARSSQFYFARIKDAVFVEEPRLLPLAELLAVLAEEKGTVYAASSLEEIPQAPVRSASATLLAKLGAHGKAGETIPEPLYLKPAHITAPAR